VHFKDAITQAAKYVQADYNLSPAPAADVDIALKEYKRLGINIPPEAGTVALLIWKYATSFFVTFVFKAYIIYVLSPIINKATEMALNAVGQLIDGVTKQSYASQIEEQWPTVDEQVRDKINAFFNNLRDTVENGLNENYKTEMGQLGV
jgi:hypothetical protein